MLSVIKLENFRIYLKCNFNIVLTAIIAAIFNITYKVL